MTPRQIAGAIAATVAEMPGGAPSGPMYAAMMAHTDLQGYEAIIDALRNAGLVEVRSNVLYPTPKLIAAASFGRPTSPPAGPVAYALDQAAGPGQSPTPQERTSTPKACTEIELLAYGADGAR